MDEKEQLINLVDDKILFDEFLPKSDAEELEEEYKQGIKYNQELENKRAKTRLF